MEKLTREEYKRLIEIVIEKKESMRKESYSNEEINNKCTELMFILIKLDAQFEKLYNGVELEEITNK